MLFIHLSQLFFQKPPCDMLLTSGDRWLVDLNKGKRVPNGLSEIKQKCRVKQF